jgi:hypothetical protein
MYGDSFTVFNNMTAIFSLEPNQFYETNHSLNCAAEIKVSDKSSYR